MSFLDKVMFWKKDEGIDALTDKEIAGQSIADDPLYAEPNPSVFENKFSSSEENIFSKQPPIQEMRRTQSGQSNTDIELISSKLDTLKAMLTTIEQRLNNLERAAGLQQTPPRRLW